MRNTSKLIPAVRLAHLLPPISAAIMLLLASVPRFFFQIGGEVLDDLSLFGLMVNAYEFCRGVFNGTIESDTAAIYFSDIMITILAVSLAAIVFYAIFALFTALMNGFVWTPQANGHPTVNKLKRAYRILVPNRACYVIYNLLPLIPSVFPYFFRHFYHTRLGMKTTLHYYGFPDVILVALLCGASCALFLRTLSAQRENRMDLFRVYKVKD